MFMHTILVELVNQKAIQLLRDMEDLSLIRIVGNQFEDDESKYRSKKVSPSTFRGGISPDTAKKILSHINQSRREWE